MPKQSALTTHCLRSLTLAMICSLSQIAAAQEPTVAREQLNALLWQQRAAEYQGSALQTYRMAGARLSSVKNNGRTASMEQRDMGGFKSKPPAIVLDIDETVLDNTPFNARLVRTGQTFQAEDWGRWVEAAQAKPVPGAREFIEQARKAKFRVVFITNRECNKNGGYDAQGKSLDCPQKPRTLDNLESALGYRPAASDLLMRYELKDRDESDKKARRMEIARTHRIALLIGDDLNDFIRRADYSPENHAGFWGAGSGAAWIVIPNAIYGSWERAFAGLPQKYAGLNTWEPAQVGVGQLKVLSWNLEWLSAPAELERLGFWSECEARGWPNAKLRDELPFCDVYKRDGILNATEYEQKKLAALRARLAELAAGGVDIFAVQETASPEALRAVLPAGYQVACFTTRVDAQNLGYAVREAAGLKTQCKEIAALSQEGNPAVQRPVRRGLELNIAHRAEEGAPALSLLNVHLKSGCVQGRMDGTNGNCPTLQQQAPSIEAWIEEKAANGQPFAIVGDWNRDLDAEIAGNFPARGDGTDPTGPLANPTAVRNIWPEINDQNPLASSMDLAATDRSAAKIKPTCHDVLDQLGVSLLLKAQLAPESLQDNRVPATLLSRPAGASDHCPLSVEFRFR